MERTIFSFGLGVFVLAAAAASGVGCGDTSDAPVGGGGHAGSSASTGGGGGSSGGSATGGATASGGSSGSGGSATGGSAGATDDGGSGGSSGTGGATSVDAGSGGPCGYTDDAQFCACLGKTCGGDTIADKDGKFHSVYCGACMAGSFCSATATQYGGAVGVCSNGGGLTNSQKQKAEMMTSIWENSTPKLAYGYSQDIGDGRGYTSGRAGFCTGTGDGILVVECYDLAKPGNPLEQYMPALIVINDKFAASGGNDIQGSKAGLTGFPGAWKTSAMDQVFKSCQDYIVDAVYYGVALRHAADRKLSTALTKAALFDSQIMHGEADPRFGMTVQLAKADQQTGPMADPPTLDDENKWLDNLLKIRDNIMKQYPEWAGNRYRVSTYQKLRSAGNWDLSKCIVTDSVTFTIQTAGDGATATSGSSCP